MKKIIMILLLSILLISCSGKNDGLSPQEIVDKIEECESYGLGYSYSQYGTEVKAMNCIPN